MDFRHPHFAEPGWLWLALLSPLCVLLLHRYAALARAKQLGRFAAPGMLADLLRSHSPGRRLVKNILLVFGIAAIGLALARPQWGETTIISQALGEDIIFVLDCSKSMLSTDVTPDRLSRSKYAILDFVQQHGRGRVGLVAFAGEAFLQCPLTFDYDAFHDALVAFDEKTIPVPGTDIGRALDEANRAMEKNDRHKVIVLVTDGEDLAKSGVTTARSLEEKGIVVYAVGVGTAAGSPIHIINAQGMPDVLRDANGQVVISRLDENTLTQIAEATHGSYHPLGALGEGLDRVRRLVENSTDTRSAATVRRLGVDRFYVPIAIALVLLVVESLLGTRRRVENS